MTNDERNQQAAGAESPAVTELDLDTSEDIDAAMREAVAAVEGVQAPGTAEDEVARLRREIADLRDRSVRTLADFDNFRKRSEREREEARRYAAAEPARELVAVVDNLERALSSGGSAEDLKRGVEMILRQVQEGLRRMGVREVTAAGAAFDPSVHEAVSREESAEVAVPTVVSELQRGYHIHDRLLRPAMVKVAVPVEKKA